MLVGAAMKADRKRLTSEKGDLVGQMKQLYSTLKDKESELRDFIRNYEQRTNDYNDVIKQVSTPSYRCDDDDDDDDDEGSVIPLYSVL